MTDEDSKFEEWWTSRGNHPYSTLWTTGKSSYLAGLAEGERRERERCAEMAEGMHIKQDPRLYKTELYSGDVAAAIRGKR